MPIVLFSLTEISVAYCSVLPGQALKTQFSEKLFVGDRGAYHREVSVTGSEKVKLGPSTLLLPS
jgi:hypothetical protein